MNAPVRDGFFEVRDRIRFELRGPDAQRYLNGQASIDVSRLKPAEARPACLLTAKGKLCAPVFIWRQSPDSFLIEAPAELAESLQARLERYIIADNVELLPAEIPSPLYHILPPAPSPAPAHPGGTTSVSSAPPPHLTAPPTHDASEKGAQASLACGMRSLFPQARLCSHSPGTSQASSHAPLPPYCDSPPSPTPPPPPP
ncbi:MAG: hypothetical protein ACKOAS_07980, partial [Verrucomicrobiota bacterium]